MLEISAHDTFNITITYIIFSGIFFKVSTTMKKLEKLKSLSKIYGGGEERCRDVLKYFQIKQLMQKKSQPARIYKDIMTTP